MMPKHLRELESKSIFILREAYANFRDLGMLWSIGKDSTVLLWLCRKAFLGQVPFPLVHIDTAYKIPEMIEYRDKMALDWSLDLVVGQNIESLQKKQSFPHGALNRIACCGALKTEALRTTLSNTGYRLRMNHTTRKLEQDTSNDIFTGMILGIRADEEGSRSKERYFSPRNKSNAWEIKSQPPEFWNQYKVDFEAGTHVRIHPLLDWTETNIWEYIAAEKIPTVSLYYNQGNGRRFRSLGCHPCTVPVESEATTPEEIVIELKTGKFSKVAERSGRAQDNEDGGGLESLRRDGYM